MKIRFRVFRKIQVVNYNVSKLMSKIGDVNNVQLTKRNTVVYYSVHVLHR